MKMNTPFYPENYDIIEGCKVYTFYVEPMYKANVYPKKQRASLLSSFRNAGNAFRKALARAAMPSRKNSGRARLSGEISF